MLRSLLSSLINEETSKMFQSVQRSTRSNTYIEATGTAEINLQGGCKAGVFYKGEGESIVLFETKFICISRGKNNLHFYHSSTFSDAVKLRSNERYRHQRIRKAHYIIPDYHWRYPVIFFIHCKVFHTFSMQKWFRDTYV